MGRGDIKSKRGKIANGSYGKKRKHKVKKEDAPYAVVKPQKSKATKADGVEEATVKKTRKSTKKTKDAETKTEE